MYRLNVSADQIDECVQQGMFALSYEPKISVGEVLLLPLKKTDRKSQGAVGGRIQHALIFQRFEKDEDGNISRKHWPNAGKTWPWIICSSSVLEVKPFCLEDLTLREKSHYQGQHNPWRIGTDDEAKILPFINWETASPLEEATQKSASGFATNSKDIAEVENFSIEQSVKELQKRYPSAEIVVMNHNNPGFDILVTQMGKVIRYIEVKGTRSSKLLFHLTETERLFSVKNSALYTLMVVSMIDLANNTYQITKRDGEIPIGEILQPFQYIGLLKQ
jgi:Domain of unknown function (DUF3883)